MATPITPDAAQAIDPYDQYADLVEIIDIHLIQMRKRGDEYMLFRFPYAVTQTLLDQIIEDYEAVGWEVNIEDPIPADMDDAPGTPNRYAPAVFFGFDFDDSQLITALGIWYLYEKTTNDSSGLAYADEKTTADSVAVNNTDEKTTADDVAVNNTDEHTTGDTDAITYADEHTTTDDTLNGYTDENTLE